MIQQSIFGKIFSDPETLKQEAAEHHPNDQVYSRILSDHGYTEMGLFNRMQYFLAVPETADKEKALLDGIDYPALFGTLSDPAFFNTLLFLHRRESVNSFTEKLWGGLVAIHLAAEGFAVIVAHSYKIGDSRVGKIVGDLVSAKIKSPAVPRRTEIGRGEK